MLMLRSTMSQSFVPQNISDFQAFRQRQAPLCRDGIKIDEERKTWLTQPSRSERNFKCLERR